MKNFFVVIALVLALAGSASAQGFKLSPEGGRFTVTFPGTEPPKEDTKTTDQGGAGSPYTTHLFLQSAQGVGVFLAGWVDYPATFKFGPRAEMEANRNNFLKNVGATLKSESNIKLGRYEGLEFTGEGKDGLYIKARVYIVGPRPYMLIGVSKSSVATAGPSIDAFLNSFELN